MHHITLSVKDVNVSEKFYLQFGFERVHHWQADDRSLQIVHLRNGQNLILEIFCYANPTDLPSHARDTKTDLPVKGVKHFALRVESLTKAKIYMQEHGIEIANDITKGRTKVDYIFIKDPDGILVEIVQDDRIY